MLKRTKWVVIVGLLIVATVAFRKPAENYFEIAKSLDIFATLFKEVNTYYVDEIDPKTLIREGIHGMLESLDPYTVFIAEEDLENFRITTTGQYAGIGALISVLNKKIIITHPYKNFPANKSGIRVGDEIIAVNGKSVQGMQTDEVSALLKGPIQTNVEVKIKRFGQKSDLVFNINREKIIISNIAFAGLLTSEVGYIKLDDFTPGASKEVADAIVKLKSTGAKKLILDLRDNPGGHLHEAVNIVNLFIPKGKEVVTTKGKVQEWNKTYRTLNNPVDTEIPLVVLTSKGSASASEIVAGALQDYDRAVLIGGKTFGKGLVQTTRQLSYNSQLKVTTAKYYIPSGRCIQKLDYQHRNQDGTVDAYADSVKSEFKSKNGRKMYDGGGLDPDLAVDQLFVGAVTVALYNDGLIFDYASRFCGENTAPTDFKSFQLSDGEYDKFVNWVKSQNFSYVTPLEEEVMELKEAGKNERYFSQIETDLNLLSKKIEENKAKDLQNFKPEIKKLLTRQFAFHYGLNDAQVAVSLTDDEAVTESISLFKDPTAYSKILSPR